MTLRQFLKATLIASGLSSDDAMTVVSLLVSDNDMPEMESRWDDNADDYPIGMLCSTILPALHLRAYQWLRENKPGQMLS